MSASNIFLSKFDIPVPDRTLTVTWRTRSNHIIYPSKVDNHVTQHTASYPCWYVWPVRVSQTLIHWDLSDWYTDRTSCIVSFHRASCFFRAVKRTNEIVIPFIRYRDVHFGTHHLHPICYIILSCNRSR